MKQIEFIKLNIQNFKGINNREINFNKETKLKGKNGVGKTTIADAVWWVLFGKDSQGRTKFNVRPQDDQGNDIHDIEIDVKLLLSINGEHKLFGRKSTEKWVTKRGESEQVLSGNETTLTVNESVVKTKEFEVELNQVLNEEDFKLLSNPMHFMNGLDDKQRREVLMTLAGNEEDIEEQLKESPEFHSLVEEWNSDMNKNKTFTMFLEYLKNKSKTDTATLKSIPDQVHALESTLEDLGSSEDLDNLVLGYRSEIERIDAQLNKVSDEPSWVEENHKKANELRNQANDLKNRNYETNVKSEEELRKQKDTFRDKLNELKYEDKTKDIERTRKSVETLTQERQTALNEYKQLKAKEFIAPEVTTVCYACKQDLKGVNVEETIEHERVHFEEDKESKLAEIVKGGKELADKIRLAENELDKLELEQKSIINEIKRVELSLESLPKEIEKVISPEIAQLETQANEILEKVKEYRSSNTVDNSSLIQTKNSYMAMIGDSQRKQGQLKQQQATKNKIEELLNTEKELRKNKIKYEVLINQALDFENEKNIAFERNLSTKFNNIQWRLFEQQVNGGFRNVCYPLLNGTPYHDQSTGERIFTGVDIIKTFNTVKEISVPVIIDNKESLTLELGLENQTINMYVDENLEELTVI